MKTFLTALGVVLGIWITALVIVVEPASAAAYQPIRSAPSRQIEPVTFATHFTQDELYKAFYSGYIQAEFSADEAARRSEELAARFAGTVELTLADGGGMSGYDLDTGSAFAGCAGYRMNRVNLTAMDESHESVGVYRWGLVGNALKLDAVADPDPARMVMLTLHPWVRQ
jgi:hypothetical protein